MVALEKVTFIDWEFNVDKTATLIGYQHAKAGSANYCTCTMCENFATYRHDIYPDVIKKLFEDLGIDYEKEAETYHIMKLDNGLHYYGAWFHFIGQIVKGKAAKISTANNSYNLDLFNITDYFNIGFHRDYSLSFFDKEKYELVQVEFTVSIPWIIDKAKEPV